MTASRQRCDGSCVPIYLDELETVATPLDLLEQWLRAAPATLAEFATFCAAEQTDPDTHTVLDQLTHASLTLHRLIRLSAQQR